MEKKIFLIYGSTTGTTEYASEYVEKALVEKGFEVTKQNIVEVQPEDLLGYEYIVCGVSTWDNGSLQYDFEAFKGDAEDVDLNGKKMAVFGPGDKAYGEMYCRAVDILEDFLKSKGAEVVSSGLKFESDLTDDVLKDIENWTHNLADLLNK